MTRIGATSFGAALVELRGVPPQRQRPRLFSAAFVTAAVAWIGLLLVCRWLWTKIEFSTEGTGWTLLPGFGLCVVAVVMSRLVRGERFVLQKSSLCTGMFMLYFLIRLAIDSDTNRDFLDYSLSYTMGMVFAYCLGFSLRVLLDAALDPASGRLCWTGAMVFVAFNLASVYQAESHASTSQVMHGIYARIENETYQTSGAMASWIAIVTSVVVVRNSLTATRPRSTFAACAILGAAGLLYACMIRFVQILGSNAGPAFMVPLAIAVCGIVLTPFGRNFISRGHRHTRKRMAKFWSRVRVALAISCVAAAAVALALWAATAWGAVDLTRYRVFGYGQATLANDSLMSRLELFGTNFATHVSYAPLFGDMLVDRRTTGVGSYLHSLVSVLPHLGVVGAILFGVMLASACVQLKHAWLTSRGDSRSLRFVMLSVAVIVWALLYVSIACFFTNAYLWLPLGLFVPAVQLVSQPVLDRKRSSASAALCRPRSRG